MCAVTGYEDAYALVRRARAEFPALLVAPAGDARAVERLRWVCEMILVRHFDDWYIGDPRANIRDAIRRFCHRLSDPKRRPSSALQFAASMLAWSYVEGGLAADNAYLLLEHVMHYVAPAGRSADAASGLGLSSRSRSEWPARCAASRNLRCARLRGAGDLDEDPALGARHVGTLKPFDQHLEEMREPAPLARPRSDRARRGEPAAVRPRRRARRSEPARARRRPSCAQLRRRGYLVSTIERTSRTCPSACSMS